MSVIGPRPLLVEYLPYYTKEEHHRHDVRPGLSGWAQINGRNAIDEGQIDIDIFDINGEYYISEVNPRFGGGYPHAYECGADHVSMIVNNLEGNVNQHPP